jgi:hypothetical protein
MFVKVKLYLLWLPYVLVLFCLPGPYVFTVGGAAASGSMLLPVALVGLSSILSIHYVFVFLRTYKGRKGTLHSLGHLMTYSGAIFAAGYLFLHIVQPAGEIGLDSVFIAIAFVFCGLAFFIAIILSMLLLFLKTIHRGTHENKIT